MTAIKYLQETQRLYKTVLVQRGMKLILRSAWLGGAAYILCWGVNSFWGWLPNQRAWIFIALAISLITLGTIFFSPVTKKTFVWRLDRLFNTKEQLSTAYEQALAGGEQNDEILTERLENLLWADAASQIPSIRRRIIDKGWSLKGEVESGLIVLILLLIIYLVSITSITTIMPQTLVDLLPIPIADPVASDIFPSGFPGDTSEVANATVPNFEASIEQEGLNGKSQLGSAIEIFAALGDRLTEEASTRELGIALQKQEFGHAASEFDVLAENVDLLSGETKTKFSEALLQTYEELDEINHEFAPSFADAAEAMGGKSEIKMGEQLDQLSQLMDQMAALLSNGSLSGGATLFEHGVQPMELDTPTSYSEEGLSAPTSTSSDIGAIQDETVDYLIPADDVIYDNVWIPYSVSWENTDVVSEYFSPR